MTSKVGYYQQMCETNREIIQKFRRKSEKTKYNVCPPFVKNRKNDIALPSKVGREEKISKTL